MNITEQWLKEQGWETHHYDIAFIKDIFHYAIKTFGTNKVYWNDSHQLTIFRDYEEESDMYANVKIDNVDSVEKLMKTLTLCEVGNFEEYDWLYETWLNKACAFLESRLFPTVKVQKGDDIDVINRHQLIDEFRKAMTKED